MDIPTSPFAPSMLPDMPDIAGVQLAVAETGQKYQNRPDLLLALCDEDTHVACVTTQSATASSAVQLCREHTQSGIARLLLVNAGNANAFTGDAGKQSTAAVMQACSESVNIAYEDCLMCSTGVIGELLAAESITSHLPTLVGRLMPSHWHDAARAIMTTDTFPKCATTSVTIGDKTITINGIAKGSGMIAPNMATMLAFFFTDAAIEPTLLQTIFSRATDKSFNCITVDGDTSTSDTALIFATGKAGNAKLSQASEAAEFEAALLALMQDLAKQIVMDGEGAQKFITIHVTGAKDDQAAHTIGMSIANSPLVKTGIAGGDANWGRIVMAVGKSGEEIDQNKLTIHFGDQCAAKNGELNPDYDEAKATEHVNGSHVDITVDLSIASGTATIWTCDLTHGYIGINGDYRS